MVEGDFFFDIRKVIIELPCNNRLQSFIDGRWEDPSFVFFLTNSPWGFFNLRWSCFQLECSSQLALGEEAKVTWNTFMSQARWIFQEISSRDRSVWNDRSQSHPFWSMKKIQPIWRQPWKINMEPGNTPLEPENLLYTKSSFSGSMLIFGGVSFQSTPVSTWKYDYNMTICLSLNTCGYFYWLFRGAV